MKTGEVAGGAKTSKVLLGVLEHVLGARIPHNIRPWQQQRRRRRQQQPQQGQQQQRRSNVKHSNIQ